MWWEQTCSFCTSTRGHRNKRAVRNNLLCDSHIDSAAGLTYSIRLLLCVPFSLWKGLSKRRIRFSPAWHPAETHHLCWALFVKCSLLLQAAGWRVLTSGSSAHGQFKSDLKWAIQYLQNPVEKCIFRLTLPKARQPCWLTNTLSFVIKMKLQITTITKKSYPLSTFAAQRRKKTDQKNPKTSTKLCAARSWFIHSTYFAKKNCIPSLNYCLFKTASVILKP